MLRRSFQFLGVLAVFAFVAGPALAVQYTIVDLGDLGYPEANHTKAYGINESGQVVGETYHSEAGAQPWYPSTTCWRAFKWDATMSDLGPMPPATGQDYKARAINNNGDVVGYAKPAGTTVACLWSGGAATPLFNSTSYAEAINDAGLLVGCGDLFGNSRTEAYLFDSNTPALTNLAALAGYVGVSFAEGLNEHGDVVGYGDTTGSYAYKPFLYDHATGTTTDLSTVISGATKAFDVNNDGWIIGEANSNGFVYDADHDTTYTLTDMDLDDINNHGQVVGEYSAWDPNLMTFVSYTCLYENGTTTNLYDLLDAAGQTAWTSLNAAYSINDSGQIVGAGVVPGSGKWHAFLMTPVPEPSTIALAAMGLVGLLCYAWRKRK